SSSVVGEVLPRVQSARTSISLSPARRARSIRALATTGSATRLADSDAPTARVRGAAGEGTARAASMPPRRASFRMGGILNAGSAGARAVFRSERLLLLDEVGSAAACETSRPGLRGGLLERRQARLRLLVGVVEPRLPACEVDLVEGVEDEQRL